MKDVACAFLFVALVYGYFRPPAYSITLFLFPFASIAALSCLFLAVWEGILGVKPRMFTITLWRLSGAIALGTSHYVLAPLEAWIFTQWAVATMLLIALVARIFRRQGV